MLNIHYKEKIRRVFKYLVHWFALVLSLKFVPSNELSWNEIMIISTIGAIVFSVLDIYAPSISDNTLNSAEDSKIKTLQV